MLALKIKSRVTLRSIVATITARNNVAASLPSHDTHDERPGA